jgi:hypothetical protein
VLGSSTDELREFALDGLTRRPKRSLASRYKRSERAGTAAESLSAVASALIAPTSENDAAERSACDTPPGL